MEVKAENGFLWRKMIQVIRLIFIFAIFLYVSVIYTQGLGYPPYGLHPVFLSYLYIGFVSHILPLSCLLCSRQIHCDSLTYSLSWISARIYLSLLFIHVSYGNDPLMIILYLSDKSYTLMSLTKYKDPEALHEAKASGVLT